MNIEALGEVVNVTWMGQYGIFHPRRMVLWLPLAIMAGVLLWTFWD